jgi:hypothetical protein
MLVVRTQLAKKRKESEALVSCIKHTSFEMFLCSRCEKRNTKCVVLNKENSGRYSKCVLCKDRCNVKGVLVGKWRFLKREEACLEFEKERALQLIAKNTSHVLCLKRQQKFLKLKGKDMVRRSLKTLDKLEEAEEKEKQMERECVASKAAATAYALALLKPDPFARIEIPLLLLEVWGDWDFASKTLRVS